MRLKSDGSVLLIVSVMLSVLTIWLIHASRTLLMLTNVAFAKQQYEQRFRLTEALLEHGIGAAPILCKRWTDQASAQATCTFDHWPMNIPGKEWRMIGNCSGKLDVSKGYSQVSIRARLFENGKIVMSQHCLLEEVKSGTDQNSLDQRHLVIKEWLLGEI